MAPGTLTVKFLAAYDLKNMDIWPDLSDPYVVVKVGGQEAKTKVIQNNLNPVWNETFDFTIDMSEVTVIDIQVFDENSFRKDAPLGKLSIPTSSLPTDVEKKREKLQDVGQGELEYEVCFKKEVSTQAGAHTPTPEFTHQMARELGFVSDIMSWKNPVMSSIALLTTDLVFLIYFFFNFSIIGLISSIALFLIAGGFIYATVQQFSSGNAAPKLPEPFELIPKQQIPYVSEQIGTMIAIIVKKIQFIIFWKDTNLTFKALAGLFALRFLGLLVGLPLVFFMGLNAAFTAPFALQRHEKFIRENIIPKTNIAKDFFEKIVAKIPKLTDDMIKHD